MQKTVSSLSRFAASLLIVFFGMTTGAVVFTQQQTAVVVQDAPLLLLPDNGRSPLLIMEKGVVVQIIRREGDWFNVTVQGSRWGDRTGYVETKYLQLRTEATVQTAASNPPAAATARAVAAAATPPAEAPIPPRAPRAVADVSLKGVRRIFIEPMPGDLDQYISAEITKEFKGRVVIVLDKANADAIMRGVGENKSGVGSAITGRYLGLHDNSTASVTLVDPNETVVLWASEAGDRSLMWGVLARGGQRKVADRLVNNLKKALNDAK
jgi:hypothetical protein